MRMGMTHLDIQKIPARALWLFAIFAVELVLIILAFQVLSNVECRLTTIETACRGLRGAVVRALCLGAMLGIYLWASPGARREFAEMTAQQVNGVGWAVLHGAGLAMIFLPLALIAPAEMNAGFGKVFPALLGGGAMATAGGLFWLARPADWLNWLKPRWMGLLALAALALILPDIADLISPLWYWRQLTEFTFFTVAWVLSPFDSIPLVDAERQIIGIRGFAVAVADSCSGIEGFALITAFLSLYAILFRETLRMGRFWLVVLPVALFMSWSLNILRIALLILIGAFYSPELAVNGFHSFAGWLFFTILAIGVLIVVNRMSWLQKDIAAVAPLAAETDDFVARIVPFIVYMLSGIVAAAFWTDPEMGYPLRVVMMGAAVWWFRKTIVTYLERPGAVAVLAGLFVGVLWIWTAPASDQPAAVLVLPTAALIAWAVFRIVGTVVLVPLIEEMFFRGYVLARLDTGRPLNRVLAIAVSSGLFALLHGRWFEAGLAGVIFAWLQIRQGRSADAITAHAVANGLIAIVAAWRGDWSLI